MSIDVQLIRCAFINEIILIKEKHTLVHSYFLDLKQILARSQKISTNLKLLLLLFLQQFQFTELLLPKVVFVIERLILFIAVNDFGSGCSDNNVIYLEFSCVFLRFLFQIY